MSRWLVHRSDANAQQVIDALKACGVHVEVIGRPVDLLLYFWFSFATLQIRLQQAGVVVETHGAQFLGSRHGIGAVIAEIKTAKGKTRSKAQEQFFERWPGPILVLRSAEPTR